MGIIVFKYSELYERLGAMHEKILNRILKELNMKGYAFEKFYSNTLLYLSLIHISEPTRPY